MRALASPASCKGALSAVEAALALAAGLSAGGLDTDALPVADGGEGTAEVFAASVGGEWRQVPASDPLGRVVAAGFLVLEDGTAVVEAAGAHPRGQRQRGLHRRQGALAATRRGERAHEPAPRRGPPHQRPPPA